jgi:hypothetical protein
MNTLPPPQSQLDQLQVTFYTIQMRVFSGIGNIPVLLVPVSD